MAFTDNFTLPTPIAGPSTLPQPTTSIYNYNYSNQSQPITTQGIANLANLWQWYQQIAQKQ